MAALIVIVVVIAIGLIVGIPRGLAQNREKAQAHDRCSFCRTRLKLNADKKSYATTCRKCGKTQPWAATP